MIVPVNTTNTYMTQNADKKRERIQMFCMDGMVLRDHLLRITDKVIDWNFIYDLIVDNTVLTTNVSA